MGEAPRPKACVTQRNKDASVWPARGLCDSSVVPVMTRTHLGPRPVATEEPECPTSVSWRLLPGVFSCSRGPSLTTFLLGHKDHIQSALWGWHLKSMGGSHGPAPIRAARTVCGRDPGWGSTQPPHWEHPICTGLSLGTLLLSSVVELGVRVQHPTWQVLQYSLKGGVGPQGHMIRERQSLT